MNSLFEHNIYMINKIIPLYQKGFPINLEIIIPEDNSVILLYDITENLNCKKCKEFTLKCIEI